MTNIIEMRQFLAPLCFTRTKLEASKMQSVPKIEAHLKFHISLTMNDSKTKVITFANCIKFSVSFYIRNSFGDIDCQRVPKTFDTLWASKESQK